MYKRQLEGRENIVVVIFYLFFALGASLFGMWNDFNGMIPIMVGVGVAMGYDAMFGFAVVMLGIGVGFAAALTNPYTIVVAQSIAGIPLYSGFGKMCIRDSFFIVPLVRALPLSATLWLIAGGALYTAGAIIFGLERPRFKLSWFGSHELFHLFVIGGSVCHYITVARCLA